MTCRGGGAKSLTVRDECCRQPVCQTNLLPNPPGVLPPSCLGRVCDLLSQRPSSSHPSC